MNHWHAARQPEQYITLTSACLSADGRDKKTDMIRLLNIQQHSNANIYDTFKSVRITSAFTLNIRISSGIDPDIPYRPGCTSVSLFLTRSSSLISGCPLIGRRCKTSAAHGVGILGFPPTCVTHTCLKSCPVSHVHVHTAERRVMSSSWSLSHADSQASTEQSCEPDLYAFTRRNQMIFTWL